MFLFKESQTDVREPKKTAAVVPAKTNQAMRATQTILNKGTISVETQPSPLIQKQDSPSTSNQTSPGTQNRETQSTGTQTDERPAINETVETVGRKKMRFVPFINEPFPWRSRQQTAGQKRLTKAQSPSIPAKMFYSSKRPSVAPPSPDAPAISGGDTSVLCGKLGVPCTTECAATGSNVNSRNLLNILLYGAVCEHHRKLGEFLLQKRSKRAN